MRLTLRHVSTEKDEVHPGNRLRMREPSHGCGGGRRSGKLKSAGRVHRRDSYTGALLLLEHLLQTDCRLLFHADFDWAGVKRLGLVTPT
jgi:hypothetical protein